MHGWLGMHCTACMSGWLTDTAALPFPCLLQGAHAELG